MVDVSGIDFADTGSHNARWHESKQYEHFDFDPDPGKDIPQRVVDAIWRNPRRYLRSPEDSGDTGYLQLVRGGCLFVVVLQPIDFSLPGGKFLIETSSGLYIPSNQAMLPQLFKKGENTSDEGDAELTKATVLYGMSWSLMAAIGSSLGGVLVATFGIKGCFVIDSITYLISAIILRFGVKGNFNASLKDSSNDDPTSTNLSLLEEQSKTEPSFSDGKKDLGGASGGMDLFVQGLKFLFLENPLVGACALLKGSIALAYGAVDVLNVSFSSRGSESDPSKTSLKLGVLFGCVGVGCILGSMVTDAISDLSFPRRIARLSIGGFFCTFVAMFWMAATPDVFASLCASTVIRTIGTSIVW
eukprot:CAMPEP_0197263690 /NCGR_PEP_ID=MMETSP1432-20130617/1326_1 /TAXON_ID=44447 /ORGANISM="Pseudo-nitzschia delicatissima, Strain UNC1205" /LENGTH=357 /DNA_ID=CAMNT_0042728227 /DNA_START=89 /DNA_END=1160 /DNA_ORIENTATION=-